MQTRSTFGYISTYEDSTSPLLVLSLFSITLLVFILFKTHNTDLVLAFKGWSPSTFAEKYLHPWLYRGDHPTGVEMNFASSYMMLYVLIQKFFSLSPSHLANLGIISDISLLGFASYYAVHKLKPELPLLIKLLFVFMIIGGSIRNSNMGNWWIPFLGYAPYAAVNFARITALVLLLKRRIIPAALLFALSVTIHPAMGVKGCLFALGIMLPFYKEYINKRAMIGILLFLATAGIWYFFQIPHDQLNVDTVPSNLWVQYAKFMNFHLFPLHVGIFTRLADEKLLPFLSLLLLFIHSSTNNLNSDGRKYFIQIASAVAISIILISLGILFSLTQNVFLIKLALQRINDLTEFFISIYVLDACWHAIKRHNYLAALTGMAIICSVFVTHYGIPVLLAIAFVIFDSFDTTHKPLARNALKLSIAMIFMLMLIYFFTGYLTLPKLFISQGYLGLAVVSFLGRTLAVVLLVIVIMMSLARHKPYFNILFACLAFSLCIHHAWTFIPFKPSAEKQKALNFKHVQEWAHTHIPHNNIVMVDPNISGWRAYSHLPSFGNFRHWIQDAWLYSSDITEFKKGNSKFNEYSIDMNSFINSSWLSSDSLQSMPNTIVLQRLVADKFYQQPYQWFIKLGKKYNVKYVLYQREPMTTNPKLPVVYTNSDFVLCKIPSI